MGGVLVMKNVSVKLFSFFSGGIIGDHERVCQNFSFVNGGSIGDQERVGQTLQLLQWREYWWSKRVCQMLQLHQWREYWWWRTCPSNSSVSSVEVLLVIKNLSAKISASSMEGVLVIKNASDKLFSFFNGGSIGDQNLSAKFYSFFNGGSIGDERLVCQTLQFLQWRQYWWSRTCLSNSSASSMEGVLMMKNVSVKLFSFFIGGSVGEQERVCQTLQLHKWREYWWWRTCLSNSSVSSVEAVLVIKNLPVKISASLLEGVLVIKNLSVKLFSFFSGGSIGDQERVCQNISFINGGSIGEKERVCLTLQLLQWKEYWWSRTCLSNSLASSKEGVLVMKNVSVKIFSFINGGSIGDEERTCQTLQLLQRRDYLWSGTCLSNSSASSIDGVLLIKIASVRLFSFINGGSIGDDERVCQTLQLHKWRV